MKKATEGKIQVEIPKNEYNQLVKLTSDKEFLKLLEIQRDSLLKSNKGKQNSEFRKSAYKEIEKYLFKHRIPFAWKEPIFNMIISRYPADFPLHNAISLKVDSQEITGCTDDILVLTDITTGKVIGDHKLLLEISAKISTEEIIQFVKKHKRKIEDLQQMIELPDYKNPIWKRTNLSLQIISMRDGEGLSFPEICKRLTDDETITAEENNYLSSEENIKTLYFRFKKYLSK